MSQTTRALIVLAALLAPTTVVSAPPVPQRQATTPLAAPPNVLQKLAPPVGPPPQNVAIDLASTYGPYAALTWSPAPNATSYMVKRRMVEDPSCCNGSSPALSTPSWRDSGLSRKGHYIFTVIVNYADGSVGSAEAGIGSDGADPAVTVGYAGPASVALSWTLMKGVSGYRITGPGLPNGVFVQAASYTTPPVQTSGTYSWTVTSMYYEGGAEVAHGPGTVVSAPLTIRSGRFRISFERFKCVTAKSEDPFRADGRGNEIYITAQVNTYDLNYVPTSMQTVRTPTFGDVENYPTRVRAGSASPTGGIQTGDEYPPAVTLISQLQPPTTSNLPFVVWEGDLSEVYGLVIISPAIWESDGNDNLVGYYTAYQQGVAPNLPYRMNLVGDGPPAGGINLRWQPVLCCSAPSPNYPAPNHGDSHFVPPPSNLWLDSPTNMGVSNGYYPMYVAINFALADSETAVNPAAQEEISFVNGTDNWQYGQYKLYVRIERLTPR